MPDILDKTRGEIRNRLNELKPLVDEYNRLQAAVAALDGVGPAKPGSTNPVSTKRRGPGRPRGRQAGSGRKVTPKRAATAGRPAKAGRPARQPRVGRRKGSDRRAAEALAAVKGQPGITIKELGAQMGISGNYLYRVMPGLQKEKKVTKKGAGWHSTS
jgi:hypothetical protein